MVMGLGSLLDAYDSDDSQDEPKSKPNAGPTREAKSEDAIAAAATKDAPLPSKGALLAGPEGKHGPFCDCEDCVNLDLRFSAKSLQTKGIRFRCKLCDNVFHKKEESSFHFRVAHSEALQAFKKQKSPALFAPPPQVAKSLGSKISFKREDVLRKRPIDADAAFGGWTKKEKPAPPPCESEEYKAQMEPVITEVPWAGKSSTPTDDSNASEIDRDVDRHIREAQCRRFAKRNVLEVNATTVRCKLCYQTLGGAAEAERHVINAHEDDFQKELDIWNRFLHTSCRRQPPFGWVCKICNLFFPTDGSTWRHIGKEVFLRQEERHMGNWHEKEDRWGHEEDEECCGDGINIGGGLSMESVLAFRQEHERMMLAQQVQSMEGGGALNDDVASDAEEEKEPSSSDVGQVKFISEF